jgi:glycosyltransferase involved in cell wall biosynthesis
LTQAVRIAFLSPEYATGKAPDGGLANYLRVTGRALVERGHEAAVIVSSERDHRWTDDGVDVSEVAVTEPAIARWFKPAPAVGALWPVVAQYAACRSIARAFWRLHAQWRFDIVQASSFKAPGYLVLRNGRVPVVTRASSYSPSLRAAYGRPTGVADRLSDRLELAQVCRADACFAPSQFVARAYETRAGIRPRVIRTHVRAFAEPQDASFFAAHHPSQRRYLLFFGTLSRIKGVDLIAEFIEPLLLSHTDLAFLFIGRDDGLPDGRKCIELIRSRAGATRARIHYLAALPKAQLLPFVANATAVVMPSRADNYPNACLEAQALGVPVIGTWDSSLDEMITDGVTGFLAKNGDAASLHENIERCLGMASEARTAMSAAVLAAARRAQSEDPIGCLLDFYQETHEAFAGRVAVYRPS